MTTADLLEARVIYLYSSHIKHNARAHYIRAFIQFIRYKKALKKYIKYMVKNFKEENYE